MNIAVLIKQVPVSNDVSVDEKTHALVRASSEGMINPADLNAIEVAMLLKEQVGGTVVVFTMGPPDAEKALRDAMALGCDEGCLITDRCFAGGDTVATAKTLVAGIKKYGDFDLVLGGALSADGATGQVGAMVAEYLSAAHIVEVSDVMYDPSRPNSIAAVKKFHGEDVKLEAQLPAVLTVCFGCNQPRLATLRSKRAAKAKPMTTYTNTELQLPQNEVGLEGSPTIAVDSYSPKQTRKATMISGTDKEMAMKIKELISIEKGKN